MYAIEKKRTVKLLMEFDSRYKIIKISMKKNQKKKKKKKKKK